MPVSKKPKVGTSLQMMPIASGWWASDERITGSPSVLASRHSSRFAVSGQLHCIEALITEKAAELRGHAEYCAVDSTPHNEETAQFMDVFTHLT